MRKTPRRNNAVTPSPASLWEKAVPYFILSASFLACFWDWFPSFSTKVFLSLDSTVLYYPINFWVHQHLTQDKLPLICDLAYNGAPVAAISMAGVLSPFLWLFHGVTSLVLLNNLLFLAPFLIFLFGAYFLGRRLGLSSTASILLAFLWTYNGQRMAQLDHWNVAWALAFFPWAFQALIRHFEEKKAYWLLLGGLFWGLNLLSGHPQIFFLEGLFFLAWTLGAPGPLRFKERLVRLTAFGAVAVIVASPLILFTLECHWDGFPKWGPIDRYFHSWTPLNFITLLFPWFFGRDSYDRVGGDYWWQYQFVEMQVTLSVAGLFFILWFLLNRHPQRRWIGWTAAFAVLMSMGKFFLLYPLVQSLPIFSLFRDPARYWHLGVWVVGLGAAYAWDNWFLDEAGVQKGRRLALGLFSLGLILVAVGWALLVHARPWVENLASWFIQHLLMGDALHTQSLASYLDRVPAKLDLITLNLDFRNPRVFLPLSFLALLTLAVWNRKNWNLDVQKGFLLALLFADLMIFRMPLGNCFYDPSKIPQPAYPAPQNRSLVLLQKNVSPLPDQYGEMAYTNWNLVSGRPSLAFDANPGLASYDKILAELGWFSWVYKDRNPMGFIKQVDKLEWMGLDQIVSDVPLNLSPPFKLIQNRYPFVYSLENAFPKTILEPILDKAEKEPLQPLPIVRGWDETRLFVLANPSVPSLLVLQKTFLPGWRSLVNGKPAKMDRFADILISVPIESGKNQVEMFYEPTSLRLGFFLFFLFFSAFAFFLGRRLSA